MSRDLLRKLAEEIYVRETVTPGSKQEEEVVERIASVVEEELSVTAKKRSVRGVAWNIVGVSLEPRAGEALASPYSSGEAEARWQRVKGDATRWESWRGFQEGRIAVIEEPEDPDDVKVASIHAVSAGAAALLVESRKFPRMIVVNGYAGYSYRVGTPSPIPVVFVDSGYVSRLADHERIAVRVEAWAEERDGIMIEADVPGKGDDVILVGAHHDKWLTGFSDNTIGVAQAILTAKILAERGFPVRFISFTFEEHGAPGYASWYWAWGSRAYASYLSALGATERIRAYINFDMASFEDIAITGSPQYAPECCECPGCDSFSLARAGVPTVCVHGLVSNHLDIYHTAQDLPERASMGASERAVEIAARTLVEGPRWERFHQVLRDLLGRGPLEARKLFYAIEGLSARVSWKELYGELAREFLAPLYYGSLREGGISIEASWFPEVVSYLRLKEDLRAGRPPKEVWLLGEERLLFIPYDARSVDMQFRELSKGLALRLEELRRRLVG